MNAGRMGRRKQWKQGLNHLEQRMSRVRMLSPSRSSCKAWACAHGKECGPEGSAKHETENSCAR
jgi:hypothetical protein